MQLFELVIALLLGGALLTAFAHKIGAPYPALLALAGAILALLPPEIPAIQLDPALALALFIAPAILDAAFAASPRDLRENWIPVTSLVLVAVCLTVAGVAIVARVLIPDMPWAAAIALGAIVAPPDAVAATSVLRALAPPHRLMVILEAEGLLNDVTALLIYRLAVGAALGGVLTPWTAVPVLLLNLIGSVVLGYVLGRLYVAFAHRINDLAISVVTQFVGTFAVWILAEEVHVSPVLTVVVYAVVIAQMAPHFQDAENRRGSYAVWEVAVFVLNALAFILIGLQLQEIVKSLDGGFQPYIGFSLAILATVVLVRFAWTFTYNALARLLQRIVYPTFTPASAARSYKAAVMVGWSGMRGLLTLATALALPVGGNGAPGFPHRDLIITAAFTVVIGTLVVQGLTLGPLMRWLGLSDDGEVERERDFARQEATKAALASLDGASEPEAKVLRREYGVLLEDESMSWLRPDVFARFRLQAIRAERDTLQNLRQSRKIGEDAFHELEEELDWAEGNARRRSRPARPSSKKPEPMIDRTEPP